MHRILIAALVALIISPVSARAQDAEDARSFVLYYYDLLDTRELEKLGALYHPDEVEEIRDMTVEAIAQDTAGDLAFFLAVRDTTHFLALSPAEGLARVLDLVLDEPGLYDDARNVTVTVGDVVPDEFDPDIVHVTYRQQGEADGETFDREGTMSLRSWQGRWRATFPPDVRDMLDVWTAIG